MGNNKIQHRQLFANDGSNRGFFDGGAREDSQKNFEQYEYYDKNKYSAEIIDEAIKHVDAEIAAKSEKRKAEVESIYQRIEKKKGQGRSPGATRTIEESANPYTLGTYNCQSYTDDILKKAEEIAKQTNRSLYWAE